MQEPHTRIFLCGSGWRKQAWCFARHNAMFGREIDASTIKLPLTTPAGSGDEPAVGRENCLVDRRRVPPQVEDLGSRLHVPDAHAVVLTGMRFELLI